MEHAAISDHAGAAAQVQSYGKLARCCRETRINDQDPRRQGQGRQAAKEAPLMDVQKVIVQLQSATFGDPGQVTEGFFIIEGDQLVMTHGDGSPVDDQYRHTLKPGDNPRAIAGVLTKQIRRSMLGITEASEAFNRPIRYAGSGLP